MLVRSDTAGYPQEFLRYCAEGKDQRFGVIEFAVGVDVPPGFKAAAARTGEEEWRELDREVDGRRVETGQQYAGTARPDALASEKYPQAPVPNPKTLPNASRQPTPGPQNPPHYLVRWWTWV